MSLFIISFIAWMLSVLAPCVLPVLPVILWWSLSNQKRYRPLIIVGSTAIFIVLFTVLLKVSTALIGIPQSVRTTISATIIIVYWLTLVFPTVRDSVVEIFWFHKTTSLADRAKKQEWVLWDVLLWASLWPIFASCSPTYALLLSVIFPQNTIAGIWYTLVYASWFALLLLAFAYGWRALIKKFARAANPRWLFKKILWYILVATWLLIVTWYMKKVEVAILDAWFFDVGRIEQQLLDKLPITSRPETWPDQGQENNDTMIKWQNDLSTTQWDDAPWKMLLNANYPSPDIAWLDNWINWWNYTSLKELKGKVVLLDFWTYSCINCIRTLEALKSWHAKYADKWLVIVWVHAPEFQFEKNPHNVKKAVEEYGLQYPVVQDNDFKTWKNYDNHYRPAKYIIDKQGNVRYTHFGEWAYEETEQVIQYLLWIQEGVTPEKMADYEPEQTHETYLGSLRADANMMIKPWWWTIDLWQWWQLGSWNQTPEYQLLTTTTWSLLIKCYASEVNLVMGNMQRVTTAEVYVDGKKVKDIIVDKNMLYNLWKWDAYWVHTIEIRFIGAWLEAYAFTFG